METVPPNMKSEVEDVFLKQLGEDPQLDKTQLQGRWIAGVEWLNSASTADQYGAMSVTRLRELVVTYFYRTFMSGLLILCRNTSRPRSPNMPSNYVRKSCQELHSVYLVASISVELIGFCVISIRLKVTQLKDRSSPLDVAMLQGCPCLYLTLEFLVLQSVMVRAACKTNIDQGGFHDWTAGDEDENVKRDLLRIKNHLLYLAAFGGRVDVKIRPGTIMVHTDERRQVLVVDTDPNVSTVIPFVEAQAVQFSPMHLLEICLCHAPVWARPFA